MSRTVTVFCATSTVGDGMPESCRTDRATHAKRRVNAACLRHHVDAANDDAIQRAAAVVTQPQRQPTAAVAHGHALLLGIVLDLRRGSYAATGRNPHQAGQDKNVFHVGRTSNQVFVATDGDDM